MAQDNCSSSVAQRRQKFGHPCCKALLKEIEKAAMKWKGIFCSWAGRINIFKMVVLLKAIHRFNVVAIKITMSFFREIEQKTPSDLYGITKAPNNQSNPEKKERTFLTSNYTAKWTYS